jgi:hypothetical protein
MPFGRWAQKPASAAPANGNPTIYSAPAFLKMKKRAKGV